jgi:hypothetical protein
MIADVGEPGAIAAGVQPTLAVDEELELRPFEDRDVETVVDAFSAPDIQCRTWLRTEVWPTRNR